MKKTNLKKSKKSKKSKNNIYKNLFKELRHRFAVRCLGCYVGGNNNENDN